MSIYRDRDELKDVSPVRVITLTGTGDSESLNAEDQNVEVVATGLTGLSYIYLPDVEVAEGKTYAFRANGTPAAQVQVLPAHGATYHGLRNETNVIFSLDEDNECVLLMCQMGIWFQIGIPRPIKYGDGAPGMVATRGALYIRTDAGAGTCLYGNTDGSTTWDAID